MVTDQPPDGRAAASLLGVLDAARDRGFVGRAAEVASVAESMLGSSEVRVHLVHGSGGIGKSTLLDALAREAARAHICSVYLDARDVACSTTAVEEAIAERSTHAGRVSVVPDVLLIDGYELLDKLDRWFREVFLPARPAGSVTVLAGRSPPRPEWRLDLGWQRLARVHELGALPPEESQALLEGLGVPRHHVESMARLGRGHPLALAMLAETVVSGQVPRQLDEAPDVVSALCRAIVNDVPDAAHRAGLATCAHATRMTQDLLVRSVGARADEVWAWLESRPYVRRGTIGLFLHDVVRELFEAEFSLRAPQAYSDLHHVVKWYFIERLFDPAETHPDRAAAELLLLHRKGPLEQESRTLREAGLPQIARAGSEDREGIFALIEAGEGAESVALARRWVEAQPHGLYRVRSDVGVEAFGMQVYLPVVDQALGVDDPVAAAVLDAVGRHGPLRPGERININRFSGASGAHQRDPLLLLVNGVSSILEWSQQPAAWTFMITVDPDHYGPYFAYLGMTRMFAFDYYGLPLAGYGWDRRRFPVTSLFEMMARRELTGESGPPPVEMMRPAALSQPAFASAVKQALPELDRPDRLVHSALRDTALLDVGTSEPAAALRHLMLATITELEGERHGAEHRRVLERTYLRGAPSQESAAELLGLPFSTYRRHLSRAQARLVEVLWSVEIGEREPAGAGLPAVEVSSE